MSTHQRAVVLLPLPTSVPHLIKLGEGVVGSMTGNTSFPAPAPALATVTSDLTALNAAEVLAGTRVKGAATARDDKLLVVVTDLRLLKMYVQGVADQNPEKAATLIESAGMALRKVAVYAKPPLAVKQGPVSGSLVLAAHAVKGSGAYDWETSLDQKTWTSLPSTIQAKTRVEGLTPGSVVFVRARPLLRAGVGDWLQAVSIIVK